MTQQIMEQYEAVRQSGACNMFAYDCVIRVAKKTKMKELSKVTYEQYRDILLNFNKYMKEFDIQQPTKPL